MRRHIVSLIIIAALLTLFSSAYAEDGIHFVSVPEVITPGKANPIEFFMPEDAMTRIFLEKDGAEFAEIKANAISPEGGNTILWRGFDASGNIVPVGSYTLVLLSSQGRVETPVTIKEEGPRILSCDITDYVVNYGDTFSVTFTINRAGTAKLTLDANGEKYELASAHFDTGECVLDWDGTNPEGLENGEYTLILDFTDDNGESATPQNLGIEYDSTHVELIDLSAYTQGQLNGHTACEHENCYWQMTYDITDEAAVWAILTAPMTVLDVKQKEYVYPLDAPDGKRQNYGKRSGYIYGQSAGVHVLETLDNGWSLIEAYDEYDTLIRGYVKSDLLITKVPDQEYGMVIDKLTQRLYIFKDGHLFTTLLCSTGLNNATQPFNETASGEFMLVSPTGGFKSGNMFCDMAIRFNGGDLIHEVPYILASDGVTKDYSAFESKLGSKASHGCVRIQRKANEDGYNMRWIWNNRKMGVKVLVWDDSNRTEELPDDSLPLFYNPDGGKYYHLDQRCSSIRDRYLPLKGEFTYGELDDSSYKKLTPCPYCNPPERKDDIIAKNQAMAENAEKARLEAEQQD
ncbi:MAG: L,D-transpeptidase family protein [Eubacteriales bacterium]|nr:L,D-transpeptidase family protein [Eubacteriales bacterium]MDD3882547.1 L,D-transpeptidase family protein [Eubacteriales bacterium]MDD4512847.1 L,D-transpeptidase family protein [Eubacteriales bacterium]